MSRHPRVHGVELVPRYTRMVGWLRRIATALLIVLLTVGPASRSVCEAVCVPPAATTEATTTEGSHSRGHHHQAAAQTPADVQHAAAGHDHHQSGTDAAASSRDSQVGRLLGRDCCPELAPPRASLTASRLDSDLLLPGSRAAVPSSAAMLVMRDRHSAGPTHGPPPGGLVPPRTPLVLRI